MGPGIASGGAAKPAMGPGIAKEVAKPAMGPGIPNGVPTEVPKLNGVANGVAKPNGLGHGVSANRGGMPASVGPGKGGRILILMSDTGGGHRASAEAIKATFEIEFGDKYKVTVIDLWRDYTPWPMNQLQRMYNFLVHHGMLWRILWYSTAPRFIHRSQMAACSAFMSRRVTKALLKFQPDVIVSVHPLMQHAIMQILQTKGLDQIPFVTVVTDLVSCHPTWFHESVTKCFLPTQEAEETALKSGLCSAQVEVSGLPIRPAFSGICRPKAELRKELHLIIDLPAVLLMGGGEGMGPVEVTARALNKSLYDKAAGKASGQLVIICGRNKLLFAKLKSYKWNIPIKIQGFVSNIADWMSACDCVITKAGSVTLAEAMVRGVPVIINSYIAGQERGNVTFIVNNVAGRYCKTPQDIASTVAELFDPQSSVLQEMAKNAIRIGRPDAGFNIVRGIDEVARKKMC